MKTKRLQALSAAYEIQCTTIIMGCCIRGEASQKLGKKKHQLFEKSDTTRDK